MADPRASVKFSEIGAHYATFKIDNSTITYSASQPGGSAGVGLAVTLSADATVALTAADDLVLGKLIRVQADNFCTVQLAGAVTLPAGQSVSVTAGKRIAGALGPSSAKGYIKEVANAVTPTATEVNNINKGRGLILDASDTTAVAVYL